MEEQNILAGDISCLNQIKSDMKAHMMSKEKAESVRNQVREAERQIESLEKTIKEEIESTVKTRREAVESGFNIEIQADQDKLKKVQNDRDKAKIKVVKERIEIETALLREENKGLSEEIKSAFKTNKIPAFCRSRLFFAVFMTTGVKDIVICLSILVVFFLILPVAVLYLVPKVSMVCLFSLNFLVAFVLFTVYKIIDDKIKIRNYETICNLITTKEKISANNTKIRKITKIIKKDKNEKMYDLGQFDQKIKDMQKDIERYEEKKARALDEFERSTKPNIIAEIDGKDRNKINQLKDDLNQLNSTLEDIEKKVKEQRIYIASNYEAYLGPQFITPEKLKTLAEVMNSGEADTIGQALSILKEKK